MPKSSDVERIDSMLRGEEEVPRKEGVRNASASALIRGEIAGKDSRRGVDDPEAVRMMGVIAASMVNGKE